MERALERLGGWGLLCGVWAFQQLIYVVHALPPIYDAVRSYYCVRSGAVG